MQILARYIATTFFKNLVLSLLGLAGLFFLQNVITQMNDYVLSQLVMYSLYDLPRMTVMVTPPATLIATVLTFSTLNRNNELIACHSIGISLTQLLGVLLPIVFLLCCLSLVAQDRLLPVVHEKKSLYYWREIKKKQDFFLDVKQDKIWYRSNNLIYHLRTFDPQTEKIFGIGVYVFSNQFTLTEVLQAENATYNGKEWTLTRGKATTFDAQTGFPVVQPFESHSLKIKESPKDFQVIEKEVDRLRIKDLIRFIDRNRQSGIDSKVFETKLHSRFSLSFIPMIMCLLAVPFSVGRLREGKISRDLSLAMMVTFFYWLSYSVCLSMGQNGMIIPVLAAWLPSIIFGVLAGALLKWRS